MVTVFFRTTGVVHISRMPKKTTIAAQQYLDEVMIPLIDTLEAERPKAGLQRMFLHHDNARSHVAKKVTEYLKSTAIRLMPHPPYSPDLAPCDFWLFGLIKPKLGTHEDGASLERELTRILLNIPKSEYKKTFDKWVERMKLCIEHGGDYFEHSL